jgi:hypothetical protein
MNDDNISDIPELPQLFATLDRQIRGLASLLFFVSSIASYMSIRHADRSVLRVSHSDLQSLQKLIMLKAVRKTVRLFLAGSPNKDSPSN